DNLGVGQSLTDSFDYAIRLSNGTLSWNSVTMVINGAVNHAPVVLECPSNVTTQTLTTAAGQVMVGAYGAEDHRHGFAYDGTNYLTIDAPVGTWSQAFGVNSNGDVVGFNFDQNAVSYGFLYSKGSVTE